MNKSTHTMNISEFLFFLIQYKGYAVEKEKHKDHYRVWNKENKKKYIIIDRWNGSGGYFIGEVSNFTNNAAWLTLPVLFSKVDLKSF